MRADEIVTVEDLVAGYHGVPVVHGAELSVRRNEAVTISGGNGAGKSTLMAAISGVLRPVLRGRVRFAGRDVADLPSNAIARMGLIHVLERRRLAPFMTVTDNLRITRAAVSAKRRREWAERLERFRTEFPLLVSHGKHLAGQLSGGQQQLVAVVRGLLPKPSVLLLDEPYQGLDLKAAEEVTRALLAARKEGTTLVFTEHRDEIVAEVSDRVVHLDRGRLRGDRLSHRSDQEGGE